MNTNIARLGFALVIAFGSASASAVIDDAKAASLMKSGGCRSCHSVSKKVVGPAYTEVAAKHKGEANAIEALTKSVRTGSKGVYGGPAPMPPTNATMISDADLHDLLEWVLSK